MVNSSLNSLTSSLRFVRLQKPNLRPFTALDRDQYTITNAMTHAISTPPQVGHAPNRATAAKRGMSMAATTTLTKETFVNHVEHMLPQWQIAWKNGTCRKKSVVAMCDAALRCNKRKSSSSVLHILCPHAGHRSHIPNCVRELWTDAKLRPMDIIVPDCLLPERIAQWKAIYSDDVREAGGTDVIRARAPTGNEACTRIWSVTRFTSMQAPELALHSIVIAEEIECWPRYARFFLSYLKVRVLVMGCSLRIWQSSRHFCVIAPYMDERRAHKFSVYICYTQAQALLGKSRRGTPETSLHKAGSQKLAASVQLAHSYAQWLSILSQELIRGLLYGLENETRLTWSVFNIACRHACSWLSSNPDLPPEIVRSILELRRWTASAFFSELAAFIGRTPLRSRLSRLGYITGLDGMADMCSHCLSFSGPCPIRHAPHRCAWDGCSIVNLPDIDELEANLVAGHFSEDHSPQRLVWLRNAMGRVHSENGAIPAENGAMAGLAAAHRTDDVAKGAILLRSWYNALAAESLLHLFDFSDLSAFPASHSGAGLKHGVMLTVMGPAHFRSFAKYSAPVNARPGLFLSSYSTLTRRPVAADIMCESEKVRTLMAHFSNSRVRLSGTRAQDNNLCTQALWVVLQQLPTLLGTQCHIIGSSSAMLYRSNFHLDIQQITLLPSFFLAGNFRERLQRLKREGDHRSTRMQWGAPLGSPAELALDMILPNIC